MSRSDDIPRGSARLRRSLTFWLRPAFVLRVVNRFQKIAGFDRSMALASSALTALVPLALLVASLLSHLSAQDLADRMVQRYDLNGGGEEAVRHLFAFAGETDAGIDILGALFLVVSALSFSRAVQRMVEQAWELAPLSVRNTINGLIWLLALVLYTAVSGSIYGYLGGGRIEVAASLAEIPVSVLFLTWSAWVLSAKREPLRRLVPFGIIAAIAAAVYVEAGKIYLPTLFNSAATRYGPIGAVFAMITALFGTMLILVASSALGREVADELDRISRGQRAPDDEVSQQWAAVVEQARSRWDSVRKSRELRQKGRPDAG
jgi:uncharacterized BrkB/YihY/UPF0761 family membrane protein